MPGVDEIAAANLIAEHGSESADLDCFHCGSPVPLGTKLCVAYEGRMRPVCCHGCQAVAEAIIGGGFDAYYARRETSALQSADQDRRSDDELAAYDDAEFQRSFSRELPGAVREVVLTLEGIRCAACVWLNEQAVQRLPGIEAFHVNLMTERATLRWRPAQVRLSQVLRSIETIGYRAFPFDQARHEAIAKANQSRMLRQLFVAGIGMMQVMMYVVPFYLTDSKEIEPEFVELMRWASLILTMPVVLYSAAPIISGAWRDLRNRRIGMDVPVALATLAAFAASTWHTFARSGEVYFDSITMFIFLLLCGRYLEFVARRKAMQGVDALMRITPKVVTRVSIADGREEFERIKIAGLVIDDVVEIAAGETLAIDVVLLSGTAEIDLSLLTGESVPVAKVTGDMVPAGAVAVTGPIRARVLRLESENMISCIQRLIDRAAGERPRIESVADRIATWFLAALLLLTAVTGAVWWFVDAPRAFPIVIALLVVSCPCALSLATPAALAAATGALARRGFLVTRGDALETLARVTDVVFDKTGTLTQPEPTLDAVIPIGGIDADECSAIAAALERGSSHPFARALRAAAPMQSKIADDVQAFPGRGVSGVVDGRRYRIGSLQFAAERLECAISALVANPTASRIVLADDERVLAVFEFTSPVRSGAREMVHRLQATNKRVWLYSGDTDEAANAVGHAVGIQAAFGALTPEDKLRKVRELQVSGRTVAMVGDGINDAPVLSGANVAIAMGDGTEIAQISADIVLLSRDLAEISSGFVVAEQTMRVIRQNLWWSAVYNGLAIPAAAFGWITPWIASLGMSMSSLLVVLNALRLLRSVRRDDAHPVLGGGTRTQRA